MIPLLRCLWSRTARSDLLALIPLRHVRYDGRIQLLGGLERSDR